MYCVAVTSTEECVTVSSSLAEALQRYYVDENYHPLKEKQMAVVLECIKTLQQNQGARARRALQAESPSSDTGRKGGISRRKATKPSRRKGLSSRKGPKRAGGAILHGNPAASLRKALDTLVSPEAEADEDHQEAQGHLRSGTL